MTVNVENTQKKQKTSNEIKFDLYYQGVDVKVFGRLWNKYFPKELNKTSKDTPYNSPRASDTSHKVNNLCSKNNEYKK